MWKLALSQLKDQPRRYISVLLAITIGITFLAAAQLVGSTSNATLRDSLGATYSKADLVAASSGHQYGPEAFAMAEAAGTPSAPGPLNEVPGVAEAYPGVSTVAGLSLPSGSTEQGSWSADADFALVSLMPAHSELVPEKLIDGQFPAAGSASEITVDHATARTFGLTVGSTTTVRVDGPEGEAGLPVTVSGITKRSDSPMMSMGIQLRAGADLFTLITHGGQAPSDDTETTGSTEYVLLLLEDDADAAAVTSEVEQYFTDQGLEVSVNTPTAQAQQQVASMTESDVFVWVLGAFAAIALLVTMLVIANTFSVLVAQRSRQLALQRVLGAQRSQIRGAVLAEAVVIGLVGSLLGVGIAIAVVAGLVALAGNFDQFPAVTFAAEMTPLAICVAVGVVLTVIASLVPAARATRVAPLEAMRPAEEVNAGSRAGAFRLILGGLALVAGAAMLIFGSFTGELLIAVPGGALSFVGVVMLAVLFVPGTVGAVGRIFRRGVPSRMARLNAVRNKSRTAATASALLIGTTLVTMMLTGGRTAQLETDTLLGTNYPVDLYANELPADVDLAAAVNQVQALPDVTSVAALLPVGHVEDFGQSVFAIDLADLDAVAEELPADVRAELAEPGTILIPDWWGTDLGDTVTVTTDTGTTELTAVPSAAGTLRPVVSSETADNLIQGNSIDQSPLLWLNVADGISLGDMQDLTADVAEAAGTTADQVGGPLPERLLYSTVIDGMLLVVTALLAVSVLIALIGVANTLSLSTIERSRENSLMRALGLTRDGLRRMLAMEAALIAGVAALLGCILGFIYGWMGAQSIFGPLMQEAEAGVSLITPAVPWWEIVVIIAVAVLAGLLASVAPARRAVKLSPVAGLAVE